MITARLAATEVRRAADIILSGGVVAFPTDTVYGVGCLDVGRIYDVKERPREKRVAYLVAEVPTGFPDAARALARRFWPGALTIVAGDDGYRMPDHQLALALLRLTGPLPTSSANASGQGATADPDEVMRQLSGRIDALLDGGVCPGGRESTVVSIDGNVLREGAISAGDVREELLRWQHA